jgi:large subunit ribosomal protein L6
MSRIGRKPVAVPTNVKVTIDGQDVLVKGPKGELKRTVHPEMRVTQENGELRVERPSDTGRHRALHGLTRSLLSNMVQGVVEGFSKQLEIQGVGYKAESISGGIRLVVGYSHPVEYQAPEGVQIIVEKPTSVKVEGIDKELVGHVAAELRRVRPPVRRKAGKTGAKA